MHEINTPNSGCLLNIGNGPQSSASVYNWAKGCKAAHKCVMRPKAEKRLFIESKGLYPVSGTLPVFSEFALYRGESQVFYHCIDSLVKVLEEEKDQML